MARQLLAVNSWWQMTAKSQLRISCRLWTMFNIGVVAGFGRLSSIGAVATSIQWPDNLADNGSLILGNKAVEGGQQEPLIKLIIG